MGSYANVAFRHLVSKGVVMLVIMFCEEARRHIRRDDIETALACIENALCCRGNSRRNINELSDLANNLAVTLAERNFR